MAGCPNIVVLLNRNLDVDDCVIILFVLWIIELLFIYSNEEFRTCSTNQHQTTWMMIME